MIGAEAIRSSVFWFGLKQTIKNNPQFGKWNISDIMEEYAPNAKCFGTQYTTGNETYNIHHEFSLMSGKGLVIADCYYESSQTSILEGYTARRIEEITTANEELPLEIPEATSKIYICLQKDFVSGVQERETVVFYFDKKGKRIKYQKLTEDNRSGNRDTLKIKSPEQSHIDFLHDARRINLVNDLGRERHIDGRRTTRNMFANIRYTTPQRPSLLVAYQ